MMNETNTKIQLLVELRAELKARIADNIVSDNIPETELVNKIKFALNRIETISNKQVILNKLISDSKQLLEK